jgi:myo-inositol-1(or 4)-monophosphatase
MVSVNFTSPLSDADVHFALAIASAAGELLAARPDALEISTKSTATDVVTHMDKLAEELLVSRIRAERPLDGILGEEGADVESQSGRMWVIDPLDGTVNYLYNLPFWAVSVGLVDVATNHGLVGAVVAPTLGKAWVAAHNQGAFVLSTDASRPIGVSDCSTIDRALIGTGFGYSQERRASQGRVIKTLLPGLRDIRRMGSCAIDLCLLAEGHLDAFYERGVNPWDHAAGGVIAREAGARVSGLRDKQESDEMLVAANPVLHALLVRELESLNADSDKE